MNNIIGLSFFNIVTNAADNTIEKDTLLVSYNEFAKHINDLADSTLPFSNILRILNHAQIELLTLQKVNRLCEVGKKCGYDKKYIHRKSIITT